MRQLLLIPLLCLGLISMSAAANCGGFDNNDDGFCSHSDLEQVVAGSMLQLAWKLKSRNRDKVVIDFVYQSTDHGLVTKTKTLKEDWMWATTPTSWNWDIPCDAAGALTITLRTYNRWFLGVGNTYQLKETYTLNLIVKKHYYADPANIIICKPDTITLTQTRRYHGLEPVWYEGVGTSGNVIGRGYSIDVYLDKPDSYAFTVRFDTQASGCSDLGLSIPAVQYVQVMKTDMFLFPERYMLTDDDGLMAGQCRAANTFLPLDISLISSDLEDQMNNYFQNMYTNLPHVSVAATGSYGTKWSPTKYRFDGVTMKVCSFDMMQRNAYEWTFDKSKEVRFKSSLSVQPYYAFSTDAESSCNVTVRRVILNRKFPGVIFPWDSVLTTNPGITRFSDTAACQRGSVVAVESNASSAVIGPDYFEGEESHYQILWDFSPGISNLTAINPTVDLTKEIFTEFGGNAKTFSAYVKHIPSGIEFTYCYRLVKGEVVKANRTESLESGAVETLDHSFLLYPNPGNGMMNVKLPEGAQSLSIINLNGQIVLERSELSSSELSIETSGLPNGMYVVRLRLDDGTLRNERWIKQ